MVRDGHQTRLHPLFTRLPLSQACYLRAKVQHQKPQVRVGAAVAELSLMEAEQRVKEKRASPKT